MPSTVARRSAQRPSHARLRLQVVAPVRVFESTRRTCFGRRVSRQPSSSARDIRKRSSPTRRSSTAEFQEEPYLRISRGGRAADRRRPRGVSPGKGDLYIAIYSTACGPRPAGGRQAPRSEASCPTALARRPHAVSPRRHTRSRDRARHRHRHRIAELVTRRARRRRLVAHTLLGPGQSLDRAHPKMVLADRLRPASGAVRYRARREAITSRTDAAQISARKPRSSLMRRHGNRRSSTASLR